MTDLEAAWDQLHASLPPGWRVGRPMWHHERATFEQFAWNDLERPRAGRRRGEWTAVGPTEAACLLEMARCCRDLREGRWPR